MGPEVSATRPQSGLQSAWTGTCIQVHHHLQHTHGSHEVQTSQLWHFKRRWVLAECNPRDAWGYWWRNQHEWRHTSFWKEHDHNLKAVFQRLREKGLTLNKSKCKFRKDRLEFFGYVFSKDSISPDPKQVADVVNRQTPSTASELRSLLGMTNYYSRFIPDYATKTASAQAHPQGPTVVLDRRPRRSQPTERSSCKRCLHCLLWSREGYRDICWCKSSWRGSHPPASGPENRGKSCYHLCKSLFYSNRTAKQSWKPSL